MLANLSIKSRLIFVIGFLSMLLMGIGILGLTSLSSTNSAFKHVYEDRVVTLDAGAEPKKIWAPFCTMSASPNVRISCA